MKRFVLVLGVSLGLCIAAPACGDKKPGAPPSSASPAAPAAPAGTKPAGSDHGDEAVVGKAEVAGFQLEVSRLGTIAAGSDAAVAARVVKAPDGKDWRALNLYVWVEDAAGNKLNAPEKTHVEKERLHAHASLSPKESRVPVALVLRLREGTLDEEVRVPLDGAATAKPASAKAHGHKKTPHDGVVARLKGADGEPAGWIEVKLHDDKGDLEVWLTRDEAGSQPLDIPAEAGIVVTFVDHADRKVTLAPRNRERNEDEDDKPNMREGKTNYFIFPGDTGADAAWLMGKAFQSIVTLAVDAGGAGFMSEELLLRPHTHAAGEEH